MFIVCVVTILVLGGLVICLWCKLHEQSLEIGHLKNDVDRQREYQNEERRNADGWRLESIRYRERLKEIADLAKGTAKLNN